MKPINPYQLVKLKTETVQNLKRLKAQTGMSGLDEVIESMIRLTDERRFNLKNTGWDALQEEVKK
jgi:hypothetical protein